MPNIEGNTPPLFGGPKGKYPTVGPFRTTRTLDRDYDAISTSGNGWVTVNFNSSLSSSIYGNSTTVTPESLMTLILIKY